MLRVGAPPQPRSILQKMREAWGGEESKGGDIRGDSKGTRVRQRYNQGSRAQAGIAPTDGSASHWRTRNRRERRGSERARPVVGPLIAFIDAILEADLKAPRKQPHTAHRIFERIRLELTERKVAEVTIRQYVRERKRELGWVTMGENWPILPRNFAVGESLSILQRRPSSTLPCRVGDELCRAGV